MGGRVLELKLPPLLVALVVAGGMYAATRILPGLYISFPGTRLVAAVLGLAGAAVSIAGVVAFRAQRTTLDPLRPTVTTRMVRSGIYRFWS